MNRSSQLLRYLCSDQFEPATIIETDGRAVVLDLSSGSRLQGQEIAGLDAGALGELIDSCMKSAVTGYAFGRFGEPRELYSNEDFAAAGTGESRTIHLGIDLFCVADTPVFSPLDGTIEIVANNNRELDYGPMLVIRHESAEEEDFFTLYGHLSLATLERVTLGQSVAAGEQIASVGAPPTNGNWPPHLHMQLIVDLLDLGTDFPGVAYKSQQEFWFDMSPSPALFFPECDMKLLEYS